MYKELASKKKKKVYTCSIISTHIFQVHDAMSKNAGINDGAAAIRQCR